MGLGLLLVADLVLQLRQQSALLVLRQKRFASGQSILQGPRRNRRIQGFTNALLSKVAADLHPQGIARLFLRRLKCQSGRAFRSHGSLLGGGCSLLLSWSGALRGSRLLRLTGGRRGLRRGMAQQHNPGRE